MTILKGDTLRVHWLGKGVSEVVMDTDASLPDCDGIHPGTVVCVVGNDGSHDYGLFNITKRPLRNKIRALLA